MGVNIYKRIPKRPLCLDRLLIYVYDRVVREHDVAAIKKELVLMQKKSTSDESRKTNTVLTLLKTDPQLAFKLLSSVARVERTCRFPMATAILAITAISAPLTIFQVLTLVTALERVKVNSSIVFQLLLDKIKR